MSKIHEKATAELGGLQSKISDMKKKQSEKMDSEAQANSNRDAYKGLFLHGAKTGMETASNLFTFHYLNVVNDILKVVSDELEKMGPSMDKAEGMIPSVGDIVPSGADIAKAQEVQEGILNRIEKLANNPEFQEKWDKLARSMAELVNTFIGHILDVVEEEGEDVINRLGKVAKKLLTNIAATGVDTVEDAMSVVPGLDAIVALFILFTSAVTDGANSMMMAMTMFNSMIELSDKFMKVSLGADNKLLDIVKEVQGIVNMFESPSKDINTALDKVDSYNKIPEDVVEVPSEPSTVSAPPTTSSSSVKPVFKKDKTQFSPKNTTKKKASLTGGKRNNQTRYRKRKH